MYLVKKFNRVESTPPVRIMDSKNDSRVLQEVIQQIHNDRTKILFDTYVLDFRSSERLIFY
ncbi:hypothetical protein LEP1GSC194_0920 [Leptospira alstonii serovar Sichuan str. 79601]|uniref:Uncharacterized protein n=1 Tax=Leptospira alstonii serovar Sichuan str. 79601 TaxID=1218565 RepID=M6D2E9_9LEPT|nr:hypothetical protein LEP1GSC194_0920 [Leptospira alstonii serovar Sichuan str. 79601]